MPTNDDTPKTNFLAPRFFITWIGIGLLRLVYHFPDGLQMRIGHALGAIAYRLGKKRRHIARVNLQLCFPDKTADECEQLCRLHFQNLGIALVEMARTWWGPDKDFDDVEFTGLEHLDAALKKHNSLVVVTGHFTTLEISGRFLKQKLPPFDALFRAYKNPLLNQRIRQGRLRSTRALIEKSDIRSMVRSLRKGISVWYAPDQSYRRKYAELLEFFDQPAMTNTATSRLVSLGGAGLICCYCFRLSQSEFRYRVVFEKEIPVNKDAEPSQITRKIITSLEQAVRAHPAQYFWVHRRFKELPEQFPDVYLQKR